MKQNTSHAVMAQRAEAKDSLDDFPTPPWATRALIEHVVDSPRRLQGQSCLGPARGQGHMSKVLAELLASFRSSRFRYICSIHRTGSYGEGAIGRKGIDRNRLLLAGVGKRRRSRSRI